MDVFKHFQHQLHNLTETERSNEIKQNRRSGMLSKWVILKLGNNTHSHVATVTETFLERLFRWDVLEKTVYRSHLSQCDYNAFGLFHKTLKRKTFANNYEVRHSRKWLCTQTWSSFRSKYSEFHQQMHVSTFKATMINHYVRYILLIYCTVYITYTIKLFVKSTADQLSFGDSYFIYYSNFTNLWYYEYKHLIYIENLCINMHSCNRIK